MGVLVNHFSPESLSLLTPTCQPRLFRSDLSGRIHLAWQLSEPQSSGIVRDAAIQEMRSGSLTVGQADEVAGPEI